MHAQTDVTSTYLTNPSFELGTDGTPAASAASNCYDAPYGWTVNGIAGGTRNFGIFNAQGETPSNFGKTVTPADGDYYYLARNSWGDHLTVTYSQTPILPAGIYSLDIAYKIATQDAASKGTLQLKAIQGETETTVVSPVSASKGDNSNFFNTAGWTRLSVPFTVAESGEVTLQIYMDFNPGGGNPKQEAIIIDDVRLYNLSVATEADPADVTGWLVNHSFELDTYTGTKAEGSTASSGSLNYPTGWSFMLKTEGWNNCVNITDAPSDGNLARETWAGTINELKVFQTLTNLPAGIYEISADARTNDGAANDICTYGTVDGKTVYSTPWDQSKMAGTWNGIDNWQTLTARFVLDKAGDAEVGLHSTHFMQFDNFRLKYLGGLSLDDYKAEYSAALAEAQGYIQQGMFDADKTALQEVINNNTLDLEDAGLTQEQLETATANLKAANDIAKPAAGRYAIYAQAKALTEGNTNVDLTSLVVNAGFELGTMEGWTSVDGGAQANNNNWSKIGTWYVERWTSNGDTQNHLSDGTLTHDALVLPAGLYTVTAKAQNQEQKNGVAGTGYFLYANDEKVEITGTNTYSTSVLLTDKSELVIKFALENCTGNWVSCDNITLTYVGEDFPAYTLVEGKMNAEVAAAQTAADAAFQASKTVANYNTLTAAIAAAQASKDAYATAATAITNAEDLQTNHNFASTTATSTFAEAIAAIKTPYNEGTLADADAANAGKTLGTVVSGWHAAATSAAVAYLNDGFSLHDFDAALYINTWSTEGESDGSNFKVPFYEYFAGDGNALGANTWTASLTGLENGLYEVSAWVRVRTQNDETAVADLTGISMNVNDGTAVDVTEGDQIGTSRFQLKEYTAQGLVKDGNLNFNMVIDAENNIHWLSFKNIKYTKVRDLIPEEMLVAPTAITLMNGETAVTEAIALNAETTTVTLTPAYEPANASEGYIEWTTSDASIATVEDGVVTAVSTGTATITATSTLNSEVSATATVNVSFTETTLPDQLAFDNGDDTRTYVTLAANIIKNGSFEYPDAYFGWTYGTGSTTPITSEKFNIITEGAADGSQYLQATANEGGANAGSLNTSWALEANKTYVFGYKVKADKASTGNQYLGTSLNSNKGQENADKKFDAPAYGTEWTDVKYKFTASEGDNYLVFNARWLGDNLSFDGFYLCEVTNETITDQVTEEEANDVLANVPSDPMNATVQAALDEAKTAFETNKTFAYYKALNTAIATAQISVNAYKAAAKAIADANALKEAHNFASTEAVSTFSQAISAIEAVYADRSLTDEDANNAGLTLGVAISGWRANANGAAVVYMNDGFSLNEYNQALYVNTWSTEGEGDGSNFKVPFYEYFAGDGSSLAANTWTATLTGVENGLYQVSAWVRIRTKDAETAVADLTGITMDVNSGTAVDVTEGDQIGESRFQLKEYTAEGLVKDGKLHLNFIIDAENNIHWLSFKNVKYTKVRDLLPEEEAVAPTAVILYNGETQVTEAITLDATNNTVTLTAGYEPANATEGVEWSTSDASVVTVENGVVTVVSAGTATITATSSIDSNVKATATINVVNADAPAYYSEIAAGDFYIVNAFTGKFLGGANSWGTHASLIEHGIPFTAAVSDGKYTLDSHAYNGNKHFFGGEWIDDASTPLYITALGDGKYSISTADGSAFVSAHVENTLVANDAANASSSLAQWYFLSKNDRDKMLAAATAENPADATYYINDANFGRNYRLTGWTGEYTRGGDNTNMNAMVENQAADVYQIIENIPNGTYTVRMQAVTSGTATFYANEQEIAIESKDDVTSQTIASQAFGGGYFRKALTVNVTDRTLKIGVKSEDTDKVLYFDNAELFMTSYTPVTGVTANIDKNEIAYGATAQITAATEPATASFNALTYSSSDETVATVDAAGVVTGTGLGEATITITANEMENFSTTVNVNVIADYTLVDGNMNKDIADAQTAAEETFNAEKTTENYQALLAAIAAAQASKDAYASAADALYKARWIEKYHTFASETAKTTFADAIAAIGTPYEEGTLTDEQANNAGLTLGVAVSGWHANPNGAAVQYLNDGFSLTDFTQALYVNTWSTEGENDGTNFTVPFYEYWTNNGESLAEKTWTGTLTGLENGAYFIGIDVRVRAKDNVAAADATGITMDMNGGEKFTDDEVEVGGLVDVTEGDVVTTNDVATQFQWKHYELKALVKDGTLNLNVNVAADNNVSWLSFKHIFLEKYRELTDDEAAVAPTSITLADATLNVEQNTVQLTPVFDPENATPNVTWVSSDEDVAVVDNNGLVTAVSSGTAIITATSTIDTNVAGEATITVEFPESDYATYSNDGATRTIYALGDNIIKNGSFDYPDNFYGWTNGTGSKLGSNGFDIVVENEENVLRAKNGSNNDNGSGSVKAIGTVWPIESGKTYVFGYKVKCSGTAQYHVVSMTNTAGTETAPLNTENERKAITYNGSWTDQSYKFTNTEGYAYVQFKARWLSNSVYFDDFYLCEVTGDDVVVGNVDYATAAIPTANIGDGVFQYSQSAIDAANALVQGEATVADVEAAYEALTTLNAPDANQEYNLVVATAGHAKEGNAVIIVPGTSGANNPTGYGLNANFAVNANLNQAVTFTKVSGNNYNISFETAEGTTYLTYGSLNGSAAGWKNSQIQATADASKKGEFMIAATETDNVFNIYNTVTNSTIACQSGGNIYTEAGNADFTVTVAEKPSIAINTTAAGWGTTILPFAVASLPEGVKAYTCADVEDDGKTLTLVEVDALEANKPYIIEGAWEETLTGDAQGAALNYTVGLLTGTYEDIDAPDGKYIMQKQNDKVGFYHVDYAYLEENEMAKPKVKANRAYLTAPAGAEGARAFFFDGGETTGINAVEALANGDAQIFNVNGVQQPRLMKGLNIIVTKDGKTHKVMVK